MRCMRCDAWRTAPNAIGAPKPTKRVHSLKVWPKYYAAVAAGEMTFVVLENARGYRAGDHIILEEWHQADQKYTGRRTTTLITFILPGGQHGIAEGYAVLAIRPLHSTGGLALTA